MSMNLFFLAKKGRGYVDFPFQTPTSLSYAVLAAKTPEARIALIEEYLIEVEVPVEQRQFLLKEITHLMYDKTLKLAIS